MLHVVYCVSVIDLLGQDLRWCDGLTGKSLLNSNDKSSPLDSAARCGDMSANMVILIVFIFIVMNGR